MDIRKILLPGLIETSRLSESVYVIRDLFVNLFFVRTSQGLICIDTGFRNGHLKNEMNALGLCPDEVRLVLLTHLHWDHCRCVSAFPHARIYAGRNERGNRYDKISENELLQLGETTIRGIEIQGHTWGSVCYLINGKYLFTGDCLRLQSGRIKVFHRLFNQSTSDLKRSVYQKLSLLNDQVQILFTSHSGLKDKPALGDL